MASIDSVEKPEPFVPEPEGGGPELPPAVDPVRQLSDIVRRVTIDQDHDRIRSATQLVNVFNFAIQVQAGRGQWMPSDYKAFGIALSALDSIGSVETEIENTLATYQGNRQSQG